jgi:hypothetical protein
MLLLLLLQAATLCAAVNAGLYGLSESATTGQLFLVNIDPKTGKQTTVGKFIASEAQAQAVATIDDKNGVYYILGYDGKAPNVMGIDVTTGAVVSEAEIPAFASEAFVGVGQGIDWEPDTGSIVVAGQDTTLSWSIGLVDPITGKFVQKAFLNNTEGKYDPVLGSPSVYTTDQRDFVMLLGVLKPTPAIAYMAVSLVDGNVAQMPWCGDTETTDYDLQSKSIYGIGLIIDPLAPGGAMRTLVQVKSDASSCQVVGNVTGYWIISMGVSAIDTENRVLYFLSFPCAKKGDPGCQGGGPLDLVGVDLRTAKTVSVASAFCTMGDTCPWSLEFANPVKQAGPSNIVQ